jgi:hypothetical protein
MRTLRRRDRDAEGGVFFWVRGQRFAVEKREMMGVLEAVAV